MITNLYFVRHAHSVYTPNELERPLSERGIEDAKIVTNLLNQKNIQHVISSPYKRAIQTVEGIAQSKRNKIEIIDDFKERTLSDKPVTDFMEAVSKVWADFDYSLQGGESNNVAQERGVAATIEVLTKYKGQNIVVGTHGNIMVLIMNYFDEKYGVQFWEQLAMPDIYKLTFHETQLIDVQRIDGNEISRGYTIYKSFGIEKTN